MDRRTFLKSTTIAAGSSLAASAAAAATSAEATDQGLTAPALSRSTTQLSFASQWAPDLPVLGDAAARIAKRIEQALGDGYVVRQVSASSEGADLTFAHVDAGNEPGFAFFAGLPGSFGLEPAQLQAWLAAGGGQVLWDDLAAQHGIKPLLAGHTGAAPGLWSSRALSDAANFAGGSIVLSGGSRPLVRAIGAEAVDLPPSKLREGLADGHLIAAEWGNPLGGLMLGLADAATHYYRGGIHRSGTAIILNVRLSLWERLGTAERIMLEGVAAHELALALADAIAHQPMLEPALARSPTLVVADFPAPLAETVDNVTAALIAEIGATSRDARLIRDSYLAFRRLLTGQETIHLSA